MGIIAWIIFGLIAGAVAKLLMPGDDPGGIIVTIVIGILGAVVGGFIATALGFGAVSGFNLGSFVIAVLGAILLLWLYRVAKSR
ncbi:GlsB/YeaQ/YmgE family stress response membrane protein [Salinisphaera orenii]|uniref:Membrane protein n=1 Tax=Salinisphaera orenii YIM 95161 TaxID=1051139 RepID=A0A423PHZ7_9GAMM|nr:GlsB/YeaQ/YmgE family stress response membrane protein [Salinisphaera halophila]ROO25210.1 membrane protein [Salinisphaera halophila YIM 95161]